MVWATSPGSASLNNKLETSLRATLSTDGGRLKLGISVFDRACGDKGGEEGQMTDRRREGPRGDSRGDLVGVMSPWVMAMGSGSRGEERGQVG